jgi:CTP synthase
MSNDKQVRYIFVTGGVVSSLGKGIVAASLGTLLKNRGFSVTVQKLDPYINVDAGTMNPYQHGEVYVTDDGAETDLDLGHYERYVDVALTADNNVTTGKVYGDVIAKERRGDYLGDTVRVIPHITDQIKAKIRAVSRKGNNEVAIVEVGGTVGDIEGLPFLEAIRQVKFDVEPGHALYVHVTLVPHLGAAGELKTKPTQHSVKELRAIGIQPDLIVCRTEYNLREEHLKKIALYTDVKKSAVFECKDVPSIYQVPLALESQGMANYVLERLGLPQRSVDLSAWEDIVRKMTTPERTVKIALVGKYVEIKDAYLSIAEALEHAGIANDVKVDIERIDSSELTPQTSREVLRSADGILVPGGFGARGHEGKLEAIRYARVNNVPYFGICYGLQWAVVEYARNVCGWAKAHSTEVEPATEKPVITHMPDQRSLEQMGGSMRLGAFECELRKGTKAYAAYKKDTIQERHRHRYEVSNIFRDELVESGLVVSGINPERNLVEVVELPKHRWFVACQYHPEFLSRPYRAHPLFREFIAASKSLNQERSPSKDQELAEASL